MEGRNEEQVAAVYRHLDCMGGRREGDACRQDGAGAGPALEAAWDLTWDSREQQGAGRRVGRPRPKDVDGRAV